MAASDNLFRGLFVLAATLTQNSTPQIPAVPGVRVGRNPLYFGWADIAEGAIKQSLSLNVPSEEYGKLIDQCDNVAPQDGAV